MGGLRGKSCCLNQITFPETISTGMCSWPHRKEERGPRDVGTGKKQ